MAKVRTSTGKVGEAVLKEYNHQCAICGSVRPQLHHIDEDPSNQDPLNLLPLCPNCHLVDQHNPTVAVDRRILKLFRAHKDPAILSAQFFPLFQRCVFLENIAELSIDQIDDKGSELLRFVSQLSMGNFYAQEIKLKIERPPLGEIYIVPESPGHRYQREQRVMKATEEYKIRLAAVKIDVERLLVEMMRYQDWHGPKKLQQQN